MLHGQSQTVILRTLNANGTGSVDTNRTLTLNGFDRNLNWHGVAEYQNRHYTAATIWVAHSVGKLNLEASYNQQIQDQFRNDTPFSNILRVDSVGRPYVDLDNTQFKEIGNKVRIPRFTATYPLEFGKWSKQYVVATATFLRDHFHIFRWSPANVAVNDNNPNPVPLANNRISFRAYLDSPEALGRGFWEQFRIENLPEQPGFRVGWNTFTDAVNPFWTARYQKTYSISSSGQYIGGKLRTLIGARFDSFDLKKTDKWTKDEYGNDIDPGGPDVAPEAFAFDPNYDLTHWTLTGGVVYTLTPNANLYGNYSESYRWQGTQDFLGKLLGPVLGYTKELGVKGSLFGNMLMYSLAAYQTDRDNASFLWSPTNVTQIQLEDLINPNNVLPSDPAYLAVPVGIRQEHRTTTSTERSRGVETTLQLRRVAGFQARVTFSYNKITSDREFDRFKELYNVAAARTAAALAPGGDPAMAEDATLLGRMKTILDQNLGVLHVTGLRSRPYNANWLVDYEFQRESRLRGTRIGLGGQWGSSYAIDEVGGTVFHDDAAHPISAYIIHRRDLFGYRTTFRGGVTNLYDLGNGNSEWRHTGVARVLNDGTPVYDYRYTALPQWTLTMTVDF